MKASVFAFLAALCGITTPVAAAGTDVSVIVFDGDASAHERELAASTILAAASAAGRPFVSRAVAPKELAALKACLTNSNAWQCATAALRTSEPALRQLAIVSISRGEGPDGTPLLVFATNAIADNIDGSISDMRHCPRCTDDVLTDTATKLARELLQELATRSGRTVLNVKSVPRGARITFDGKALGATDLSFNTYPGPHEVTLELDGYQIEARSVEALEDRTVEIAVPMRPLSAAPTGRDTQRPPARRSRLLPGALIGVGLAGMVTGAVMIAIDEDPVSRPGQQVADEYRDSATRGAIIGVAGLAVGGVGGFLWWKYTRSSTAPQVSPMAGGATFGVVRAF